MAVVTEEVFITPSEVIEYLYCPRFIYFMNCLSISQHEEQRYKVLKGRDVHKERAKINRAYLRKKLGCTKREKDVYLVSKRYHLRGIVDEVLFLSDETLAPFDYKFAKYQERLFKTYELQSAIYALLIREAYGVEVDRGFVCYTRSNYLVKQIDFAQKDFDNCISILGEILDVIQKGFFPKKTSYQARCIDCCYKNICVG